MAEELIFYNWSNDAIEAVFADFTAEYGVKVTYITYYSQEEAVENMRAGEIYDAVVMENQFHLLHLYCCSFPTQLFL